MYKFKNNQKIELASRNRIWCFTRENMHLKIKKYRNLCQQAGFSLIELMISIPLGLLVLFAVLKIFTANIEGVNLQNSFSRVQEHGRMSMELMVRDIRMADYWGCANEFSLITNNLNSSDSDYVDYAVDLMSSTDGGIAGENDVASSSTIDGISVQDGTDTLTLRGSEGFSDAKIVSPYMTTSATTFHVSDSSNFNEGEMVLISDCEAADLFSISSIDSANGTVAYDTGSIAVDDAIDNLTQISHTYDNTAQLLVPYIKTYFIGENTAGSSSLYRSYNGTAEELVRGVTDLQLMYGEDRTSDGSVDTFSSAGSVSNMDDVSSIRLQLVSDSGDGSVGTSLERTYTVTANIRNRTL